MLRTHKGHIRCVEGSRQVQSEIHVETFQKLNVRLGGG